jgi:hypothetical protein
MLPLSSARSRFPDGRRKIHPNQASQSTSESPITMTVLVGGVFSLRGGGALEESTAGVGRLSPKNGEKKSGQGICR